MKSVLRFADWVIYQIYPRSFKDSNNDGIGDLNGITEKIEYLKELGVNAVWLSPCYQSPNEDNGYDISDYRDIMDEFGTLDDFRKMIQKMHEFGIRLIMDLVPNHTSTAHEWFQKSRKRIEPYSDYYYWFDQPQNEWNSCFGGSAWEYDNERKQYYLHSYAVSQADLNWNNPQVRKEMCNIIDYWVNLGVDGFRIDVIDQISKNMKGSNCFGPDLHAYIHEMFGRKEVEFLFTVGECWADSIEEIARHCGEHRGELKTLFQFEHMELGRNGGRFFPGPFSLKEIFDVVSKWEKLYQEKELLYSLFMENHDQPRFISRFGNDKMYRYESATMFAMAFYLLKGVPFIFQGQEIGVKNQNYHTFNHFKDIENIWFYKKYQPKIGEEKVCEFLNFGSRDNSRRPMPWNDSIHGGFSDQTPWISENQDYKEINVESEKKREKSIFRFYQELIHFRLSHPAILYGEYIEITTEQCFAYIREYNNESILVVCNYDKEKELSLTYEPEKLLFSNYKDESDIYRPYECRAYLLKKE